MRNFDINTRELNDEFRFVVFENDILHGFTRTAFLKQKKRKIGKTAMLSEIKEVENTLLDSNTNHELAKLVYANRDKFPAIFHSGV